MSTTIEATTLANHLHKLGLRIVLAESCTAGLAAAKLGAIAGISEHLCGSAVTYREQTKIDWLHVAEQDIAECSAVSAQVTRQMAVGVLEMTREADVSLAITGHLGPDAPPQRDGVVCLAFARRHLDSTIKVTGCRDTLHTAGRLSRQEEAVSRALKFAITSLEHIQSASKVRDEAQGRAIPHTL